MVNRDVVLAKVDHLKRHSARLKQKQGGDLNRFLADPDLQDIVLMNLQAAIQNLSTSPATSSPIKMGVLREVSPVCLTFSGRKR